MIGPQRARDTWSLVADKLDQAPEPVIEEELFMAAPRRLLARLRQLDDAFETVLVVGHNPGLEALAAGLAGSGKTGLLATLKTKFPTATVAVIDLPADRWKDVVHFVEVRVEPSTRRIRVPSKRCRLWARDESANSGESSQRRRGVGYRCDVA
jgi:phosphohistidine phosphatase SixA